MNKNITLVKKNGELKSLLRKFIFLSFFFASFLLKAQTAFTSGDKVDVYYGGAGAADVIADDNDSPDVIPSVSSLGTSNQTETPLLTAGDVVVYRNAGTEGGLGFDVVAVIDDVVPFSGTLDSAPSPTTTTYSTGSIVDGNGHYPNFVMPTGSASTVGFAVAPSNVFGGNSAEYSATIRLEFYEAGTYIGGATGTPITLSPIIEFLDIDRSLSSGGTDVQEFVKVDLDEFDVLYVNDPSYLVTSVSSTELLIESLASNNSNASDVAGLANSPVLTASGTATGSVITVVEEELTARIDATDISDITFTVGSLSGHTGPAFKAQAKGSDSASDIQIATATSFESSDLIDTDGDGISDGSDLDDDNDGILDINEGCTSVSSYRNIVLVVDESGSIDTTEAAQIRTGLTSFMNSQIGSGNTISLVGMSNSDDNTRTDHVLNTVFPTTGTTVPAAFTSWITDYRNRSSDANITFSADFWASGLEQANALSLGPDDEVILVADGFEGRDTSGDLFKTENAEIQADILENTGAHIFIIGVNVGEYLFTTPTIPNPSVNVLEDAVTAIFDNVAGSAGNGVQEVTDYEVDYGTSEYDALTDFTGLATSLIAVGSTTAVSLNPDSDGDGVADCFDLDSDNDGCPDYVEAGGTFTEATNGVAAAGTLSDGNGGMVTTNLGNTVGGTAVGVPDVAGSGQTSTSDVTTFGPDADSDGISDACDDEFNDNDNDGVADVDDIDDDNDGILDIVESLAFDPSDASSCFFPPISFLETAVTKTTDNAGGLVGDVFTFQDVITVDGTNLDARITIVNASASIPEATFSIDNDNIGGNASFWQPEYDVAGNTSAEIEFKIELVFESTETLFPVSRFAATFNDIDGATANESIILKDVDVYVVDDGTQLTISDDGSGGTVFQGPQITYSGVDLRNDIAVYAAFYEDPVFSFVAEATNASTTANTNLISVDFDLCSVTRFSDAGQDYDFVVNTGIDSDNDGFSDEVDIDSDNDGITDNIEAQATDQASFIAPSGADSDMDGLLDVFEGSGDEGITPVDTDGDLSFDYIDSNSDDEGANDGVEAGIAGATNNTDVDEDGLLDVFDSNTASFDSNNNGGLGASNLLNIQNPSTSEVDYRDDSKDFDGDGYPDETDLDDDNDGILDTVEELYCQELPSSAIVFNEDFGTGARTTSVFVPTAGVGAFSFESGGDRILDSEYAVDDPSVLEDLNSGTFWNDVDPDHTEGDTGGRVLVVNAAFEPGTFYERTATGLTVGLDYEFIFWVRNGNDSNRPILPNIEVLVESTTGVLYEDITSGNISRADDWVEVVLTFEAQETSLVFKLVNNAPGGNGNDLFLDDIVLREFTECDLDGDGIPNKFDLDSDGDGILDIVEAGNATDDADGNGKNDGPNTGANGIPDTSEDGDTDGGGVTATLTNTDSSGFPNPYDIDADDDGIPDNVEAQSTADYQAPSGSDDDLDGIDNLYDVDFSSGAVIVPVNTDISSANADTIPDYLDLDSDNDGLSDSLESGVGVLSNVDVDMDGLDDGYDVNTTSYDVNNNLDSGSSDTTKSNSSASDVDYRVIEDTDEDGIPDSTDLDNDNDGILDTDEEDCDRLRFGLTADDTAPSGTTFLDTTKGISVTPTFTDTFGVNNSHALAEDNKFEVSNTFTSEDQFVTWDIAISPLSKELYLTFTDFDQNTAGTRGEQVTINLYNGTDLVPYVVTLQGANVQNSGNTFTAFQGGATSNDPANDFTITVPKAVDRIEIIKSASLFNTTTFPGGSLGTNFRINSCFQDTDGDGIADKFDTDSDNDGCPDADEAYGDIDADADNNGTYGSGTPTVNTNGLVDTAPLTDSVTYTTVPATATTPAGNTFQIATEASVNASALVDQLVIVGAATDFAITDASATSTNVYNGTPTNTPDYSAGSDTSSDLNYQWYIGDPAAGGATVTASAIYSGEDSATLIISDVTGLDGTEYYLKVTHSDNVCVNIVNSAILSVDPDNDGDGIGDSVDLDDDNDGILDSDEINCSTTPPAYSASESVNFDALNLSTSNSSFTDRNFTIDGYTSQFDLTRIGSRTVTGSSNGHLFLNSNNATSATNVGVILTFEEPVQLVLSSRASSSPISGGSFDSVERWTLSSSGNTFTIFDPSNNLTVDGSTGANGNEVDESVQFFRNGSGNGGNLTWQITTEYATSFRIILNSSTGNANAGQIRVGVKCVQPDNDRDGIADFIDLDSDNDGCPDAIEGGDNVTASDLTASNSINSLVDSDGVPVSVGATGTLDDDGAQGQGVGGAQQGIQLTLPTAPVDTVAQISETVNFTASGLALLADSYSISGTPTYGTDDSGNIIYNWFVDEGSGFGSSTIGSGATLPVGPVTAAEDGYVYKVVVTHPSYACPIEALATLTIAEPPVLDSDTETTDAVTPISIDVTDNDINIPNIGTTTITSPPSNGSVIVNDGGTPNDPTDDVIMYTPEANFSGTDTFIYEICDDAPTPNCDQASVTITVLPLSEDDEISVPFEGAATFTLSEILANDIGSFDTTTLTVDVSEPTNGTLTYNSVTGLFTYEVEDDFTGADSFDYTICDSASNCTTATVNLVVPPAAIDDEETTPYNTAIDIDVLSNDVPLNVFDTSTITLIDATGVSTDSITDSSGVIMVNSDGTVSFEPVNGFVGSVTYIYMICDTGTPTAIPSGGDTCTQASITITVSPPPTAVDDLYSTNEETSVALMPLDGDTDVENDTLTITSINGTAITAGSETIIPVLDGVESVGTVTVNPTGDITFTPAPNYNGTVTIPYEITDGNSTATANEIITVVPVNDIPVAEDDSYEITEGDTTTINIEELVTDVEDDSTTLVVTIDTVPNIGTLTLNGNEVGAGDTFTAEELVDLVYESPEDVAGATNTVFNFTVTDSEDATDTGIVTVNFNNIPEAEDSTPTVTEGEELPIDLEILVTDVEDDSTTLTVTIDAVPNVGTLTLNGVEVSDGDTFTADELSSLVYEAPEDLSGDTVTMIDFTVTDSEGATDTGLVTIEFNNPPEAEDASATVAEGDTITIDLEDLVTDVEDDSTTLTVTIDTVPNVGTLTLNGNEVEAGDTFTAEELADLVYETPNETNDTKTTFGFTVTDTEEVVDTGVVDITLIAVPDAEPDTEITNAETSREVDIYDNDNDIPTNGILTVTNPSNGMVTITDPNNTPSDPSDDVVTYIPNSGYSGEDMFSYEICDNAMPIANCDQASVTITVLPLSEDNIVQVPFEGVATFTLTDILANDIGSFDTTTLTIDVSEPTNGTLTYNSVTGLFTYEVEDDFTGADSFDYTICDSASNCTTATVNLVVPPAAIDDEETTPYNTAIDIDVLSNDVPLNVFDTSTLTLIDATGVSTDSITDSSGVIMVNSDGTVSFEPVNGFVGSVTYIYMICDTGTPTAIPSGGDTCTQASITITVSPPPIAVDDLYSTNEETSIALMPLDGDTDVENDTLTVTSINGVLISEGSSSVTEVVDGGEVVGTLTISPTGDIAFIPAENFNGVVTLPYVITDGNGGSATANEIITVVPVNDIPVAEDDSYEITEGDTTTINIEELVTDVEDDSTTLVVTIDAVPNIGTLTLNGNEVGAGDTYTAEELADLVYEAPEDLSGDTGTMIDFTVTDSEGATDTGVVTIEFNNPPEAEDATLTVTEGEELPIDLEILVTDVEDDSTTLTVTIDAVPNVGTLTLNGVEVSDGDTFTADELSSLVYETPEDLSGDTGTIIDFTVTDSTGAMDTGAIIIEFNNPPEAEDARATVTEGEELPIDLESLVTDVEDDSTTLTITIDTVPNVGTLTLNGNEVGAGDTFTAEELVDLVYETPSDITVDTDTGFDFTVTDSEGATDTGVIEIILRPVLPVAENDEFEISGDGETEIDVLVNDLNPSGEELTITEINGEPILPGETIRLIDGTQITLTEDGTLILDPISFDPFTFEYTISDESGNESTAGVDVILPIEELKIFREFSPNGDGINDYLYIGKIEDYPNNTIEIFNRWGNTVYTVSGYNNDDPNARFTGESNGRATISVPKQLPVGTYFYVLDLGEGGEIIKGWIYINR